MEIVSGPQTIFRDYNVATSYIIINANYNFTFKIACEEKVM